MNNYKYNAEEGWVQIGDNKICVGTILTGFGDELYEVKSFDWYKLEVICERLNDGAVAPRHWKFTGNPVGGFGITLGRLQVKPGTEFNTKPKPKEEPSDPGAPVINGVKVEVGQFWRVRGSDEYYNIRKIDRGLIEGCLCSKGYSIIGGQRHWYSDGRPNGLGGCDLAPSLTLCELFDPDQNKTKNAEGITDSILDQNKDRPRAKVLNEAANCVLVDRATEHGDVEDSFNTIAGFWSDYLTAVGILDGDEACINPNNVAVMMALLKVARQAQNPENLDNYVDCAGYMACGFEAVTGEKGVTRD